MRVTHFVLAVLMLSCVPENGRTLPPPSDIMPLDGPMTVKTVNEGGIWRLTVNGEEFYIKGAAGNSTYVSLVDDFGGNAIRTYGVTEESMSVLNEAYENGLMVNFGLYAKRERDGFDYNDENAVREQLETYRRHVRLFKDHPALLMWSIANEAESKYTNVKLWDALGDIVDMIHEEDPNHPVALSLASANPDHVANILQRAPNLDILGVNQPLPNLPTTREKLQGAGWDRPYMITEYGPRGMSNMNPEPDRILAWPDGSTSLVEQTSTEKAMDYFEAYSKYIYPEKDNACIGSFVFHWGYQTHGAILNWYATTDKKGYTFPSADVMQFCWTGKYPDSQAPVIASREDMTMDGRTAGDAIVLRKGTSGHVAEVVASDPQNETLVYEWIIVGEGTSAPDGSMHDGIAGLIEENLGHSVEFTAPGESGAYRMYVFVRNMKNSKVASAVIPFYAE